LRSILALVIGLGLCGTGSLEAQIGVGLRETAGAERHPRSAEAFAGDVLAKPMPVGAVRNPGPPAEQPLASRRDPVLSGEDALIAGLSIVGTVAISPVDRYFAERLQHPRRQELWFLRHPAETLNFIGFPGSIIIGSGLYLHGIARDDRETAALGLHGLEAIAIGTGLAVAIKGTVGRARPYLDVTNPLDFGLLRGFGDEQYRSFPSGHTVAGFAAATVVTSETSQWWPGSEDYIGPVMYVGATLIGASRMYTNNHWASDVVMGAAIGTLAGVLINRYHRDQPDNWLDRQLLPDEGRDDDTMPLAASRYIVLWSMPLPR
jgi:membrane-associated phospholipid phosphatase